MQDQKLISPRVKTVLKVLAGGTAISIALLMPGAAVAAGMIINEYDKYQQEKEAKEFLKYNSSKLKQMLTRLEREKLVRVEGNKIVITNKGKTKVLDYQISEMTLKKVPDGKWRIIMYDISEFDRKKRQLFQKLLKSMKLYQLQKSVYLTPFPCENEIEYLRQKLHIGPAVTVITAVGLENEEAFKKYFGI